MTYPALLWMPKFALTHFTTQSL